MIAEILTLLAILNATVSEQSIPIEVTTTTEAGTPTEATPVTPTPALDTALILGLVGVAITAYTNRKTSKSNEVKADALADSTVNVKESLKQTDYGVKELAENLSVALNRLQQAKTFEEIPQVLAECAPKAKENAKAWQQDVKEYYENKPPTTNADLGLDKTRAKLVDINKETKKTPTT